VAIDISAAYILAVSKHLPRATLVFDHFHVVKLFNDKLSDLRRDLHREAKDQLHKDLLKGTRWLLLKNPDHLDDEREERRRLAEALQLNHSLATAYYLKEDLRQLWSLRSNSAAGTFLTSWRRRAEASSVRLLARFAHTLRSHRAGLPAWHDVPISTEWAQSVPDVTLPQLESALAEEHGVPLLEVRQRLRRLEKVFREAKSDLLEARRMKAQLMKAAMRG